MRLRGIWGYRATRSKRAQRLYEALCLEGYTGAVDTVRRQMRAFERRRVSVASAFIPQYFAPGEAYQFDFSHEHVELGGIDQVVKLVYVRLGHPSSWERRECWVPNRPAACDRDLPCGPRKPYGGCGAGGARVRLTCSGLGLAGLDRHT